MPDAQELWIVAIALTGLAAPVAGQPGSPLDEPGVTWHLQAPYKGWLDEDVRDIITPEEREAFVRMATDEERENFIESFWMRRDPTPGTPSNEYKEEQYRRIAYANDRYSSGIPGWKTDRGRIYIVHGPPDEIESHPSGGEYRAPGGHGGFTASVPFEVWRYRWSAVACRAMLLVFVDADANGVYKLRTDLDRDPAPPGRNTFLWRTVWPPFDPNVSGPAAPAPGQPS